MVSVLIKYDFNKMKGNITMNETTKKNKDSNRIATVMAVVLSLALILAGTYAFTDFAQHSTNPFSGGEKVSVTLNDNYTPPVEWLSGQTVNKQVSVTNTDESNRAVYVRLQLKEYMESYNLVPVQESGENVLFATYADGANKGKFMTWADAVAGGYEYTEYIVNGVSYARTSNDELRNGIYGKAMYIHSDLNIYGTADKADYIHEEQHTDECDYNVHKWDGNSLANRKEASDTIADYISWTLGTDVMLMSDWQTSGKPTGNFWVLDEEDGWIYWATAIAPGESTSNILESVTLDVMPGASFEYYIHIDMEAVTYDDLDKLKGKGASDKAKELIGVLSDFIPITGTYFPSSIFRAYVVDNFDTNSDGYLTKVERDAVTEIYVSGQLMADLTGIEHFTKLELLICEGNQLTELDLSKNTALFYLDCFENQLTKLDLSNNTALRELHCQDNLLTELDVSNNTALGWLECSKNQLTKLDVSKNTALIYLDCQSNPLEANLDVSNNTALTTLICADNQLTALDVSSNIALEWLYCCNNQIRLLDISSNTAITSSDAIQIQNNGMTELKINAVQAAAGVGTDLVSHLANNSYGTATVVTP